MAGICVFKWEKEELTILHNRENWEKRVINAADWDETKKMLGGRCDLNDIRSWFVVSKSGRFAFLVDSTLHEDGYGVNDIEYECPALLPMEFVDGESWTPESYADMEQNGVIFDGERIPKCPDPRNMTYTYHLIVGDIKSGSMYYISKPGMFDPTIDVQQVPFGVHTLSSDGLDNPTAPTDLRLRSLFDQSIDAFHRDNNKIASLKKLAKRVLLDRVPTYNQDPMSSIFVEKMASHKISPELGIQRYGTSSSTAFSAKQVSNVATTSTGPAKIEAMLYEINHMGSNREFSFDI